MAGKKGRSGSGGKREGAGRPKGAVDTRPRIRLAKSLSVQRWEFAKHALQYADEALDRLAEIMRDVEAPGAARLSAIRIILDRALGKAPRHGDVSALNHTEIVYRSTEEIERVLMNRGVPEFSEYSKDSNDK